MAEGREGSEGGGRLSRARARRERKGRDERSISADGRDVDHSVSELNEGTTGRKGR